MSDELFVRNCAPTLAGIKTGCMFSCAYEERSAVIRSLRRMNHRLKAKGLRVVPLRFSQRKVLVYVYRPRRLSADLSDAQARSVLECCGYHSGSCEQCVVQLARRVRHQEAFPHEIGLFLGYPPEDVRGFMEKGPDGAKCTGFWRVYGDAEAAEKKFAQYRKCNRIYRDQWAKGKDIERLTVAG